MAVLHPFKGYRPTKELCAAIAALPYDVMSSAEAREMVEGDPYSFLHVDRAEVDLPIGTDMYSPEVYRKAADNLNGMIERGIYIQDKKPVLYVYRLTMDGRSGQGAGQDKPRCRLQCQYGPHISHIQGTCGYRQNNCLRNGGRTRVRFCKRGRSGAYRMGNR